MRVLLTGATGFVGSRLMPLLAARGHAVLTVSRRPGADADWSEPSLARALARCDAIVHLAGENLFERRWSAEQKKRLRASRIDTTRTLSRLAAEHGTRVFVGASAVGWYGARGDETLDERSAHGSGFLAELCRDWEEAADRAREAGVRTAHVRSGVVLGKEGGALARMLPPFRFGVGGPLGTGRQQVSWIHLDDVCGLYAFLLERERAQGPYNGTAPHPATMRTLAKTLGGVLSRPAVLPVPGPVLRLALGEGAETLLTGQRVLPTRAQEAGFTFAFPELEPALRDLLGKRAHALPT